MTRILITGGAGCLGSNLTEHFLEAGHDVLVLDNFATGHRGSLPNAHPKLSLVEGSITRSRACRPAVCGIHAEPRHSFRGRLQGSGRLARGCAHQRRRHHQCRRSGQGGRSRTVHQFPYRARVWPARPATDPGGCSRAAVHELRHFKTGGRELSGDFRVAVRLVAARQCHRSSPGDRPDSDILHASEGRQEMLLLADGSRFHRYGGFLFGHRRRDAIGAPTGIFNVSTGTGHTIKEIFDIVVDHLNIELRIPCRKSIPGRRCSSRGPRSQQDDRDIRLATALFIRADDSPDAHLV